MKLRRYQLRKHAVAIVASGHPWIFRDHMSSAADVFADGDWLHLVDGSNRTVGFGIYQASGAIAIRVIGRGELAPAARTETGPVHDPLPIQPDASWLRGALAAAVAQRARLAEATSGLRLVHGENDGIPGLTIDRFGDAIVIATYAAGCDALARYAARWLLAVGPREAGPLASIVIRSGHRRARDRSARPAPRVMRGQISSIARFSEDGITYAVDLARGQKTGAFLDLRGLRRAIAASPLAGARVLNLFAYTGMLGRAAEHAGASEIISVDASADALAFAAAHHVTDPARHRLVTADVFADLAELATGDFDLVIVDPPAMTSERAQVPRVLAAYRKLYATVARHVRPGGALVAACCTSRITRAEFEATMREALGSDFVRERSLAPEPDHPVGFREADYLKILWFRRRSDISLSPGSPQ